MTPKLDTFTTAYIECALWSSTDDNDTPLDSTYDIDDLSDDTRTQMILDCDAFQRDLADTLDHWYGECGESAERAGHDFWLTRNRHGAGFWDRWNSGTPQGKIGKVLTDAAHSYGSVDLYVGDDGEIHS